jgi:hypothetical protein
MDGVLFPVMIRNFGVCWFLIINNYLSCKRDGIIKYNKNKYLKIYLNMFFSKFTATKLFKTEVGTHKKTYLFLI